MYGKVSSTGNKFFRRSNFGGQQIVQCAFIVGEKGTLLMSTRKKP